MLRKKNNVVEATYTFARLNNFLVTHTTLKQKILNHADYPSIVSIGDTLNSLGVKNYILRINFEDLAEIPPPFLSVIVKNGEFTFAPIRKIDSDKIEWWNYNDVWETESFNDFSKAWTGAILITDKFNVKKEKDYEKLKQKEILREIFHILFIILFIIVFISGIFIATYNAQISFFYCIILLSKAIGVIVTSILLSYSIDSSNSFVKNICTVGKKTDCNSILDSKAANIGGLVTWSEIGFFYFLGSFLMFILGFSYMNIVNFLMAINILSIPYTFYSIYYQYKIAQKWCLLCLIIQALLWVEFLSFQNYSIRIQFLLAIKSIEILTLLFSFGLPIIFWVIFKPILAEAIKAQSFRKSLWKFQNDATIFNYLITQQPEMLTIDNIPVLSFGDPSATNVLTMVTNPFCRACGQKHLVAKTIIEENINDIRGQIIFVGTNNDEGGSFIRHLFSLNENLRIKALIAWYEMEEPVLSRWKQVFPFEKENLEANLIVDKHDYWVSQTGIQFTPTFFFNNNQIPSSYSIEDLKRIASKLFN